MLEPLSLNCNILIVDDSVTVIEQLRSILEEYFKISVALDGQTAISIVENSQPDLILLDIGMPEMDGFEVCEKVKSTPSMRNIPIIFLTATKTFEDEERGFALGAADFVSKPFSPNILLARINTHLRLSDQRKLLEHYVSTQKIEVSDLNIEIIETQKELIHTMGSICESRSKETANHVKRVAEYSKLLGTHYGLDSCDVELLHAASPMHDIGKVAISDEILKKPGKLSQDERKTMETHTVLGFDMLCGSNRKLLHSARITALEHHEKWNGQGYPKKLKGEEIHAFGRITAVADVFDALSHDRCYKKAWEDEKIFELLKTERGEHFDPRLIDIFFNNINSFLTIRENYND